MSEVDGSLSPAWVASHGVFHHGLVGACGSRHLLDLHARLYQLSERYRGLSTQWDAARDVDGEHQGLVDAALDHDIDLMIARVTSHIRMTTERIVASARRAKSQLMG
ncbi:MAG: FCD domain-containing protein [Caulobacteraceae bacterium]|nr:FCD domain-containing protein [Caulobacteraceae bacterium]